MNARIHKVGLGLVAAALALQANAQSGGFGRTPASTPAPATTPAPAAPPASATPGSTAAAPADQGKAALETVHAWALSSSEYAKVAGERATSPDVKQLAASIVSDAQRVEQEAQALAKERGIQLAPADTAGQPGKNAAQQQLASLPAGGADAKIAGYLADDRRTWVDRLKGLRDQTPDGDSKLKGWLDKVEDTAEKQSNDAFAARHSAQDAAQRQGRTPAPSR